MSDDKWQEIGSIDNYYGGLNVKTENGKFYWAIENWDGFDSGEEISKELYDQLIKHGEEQ